MDVEADAINHARPGKQPHASNQARYYQGYPRIQKQPPGTVHQQESEMPPPVPPGPEMRRVTASVGGQRCWNFCDLHSKQACLYDHFAGEFHAGRPKMHAIYGIFPKCPHSAVKVSALRAKKELANPRQHRISEISMERRHGAGLYPAAESVAHNKIRAGTQFCYESG